MKKYYNLFLLIIFISLFGCSSTSTPQKSNLTFGMAKSKIIEGKTSQAEILNIFGAPNLTTRNSDKKEVWNYNKMSFDSGEYKKENSLGGLFSPLLFSSKSSVVSTSTSSSFDLIIVFNQNDIVESYKTISASY